MKAKLIIAIILAATCVVQAKIDLTPLPSRDAVQLTIYNSADMTLVRESRKLTLNTGQNNLQFSWANTLIDPTSLEMLPKANVDKINIADLSYPPRVRNLGLWNIESGVKGEVPMEISYLTSGLSWRAFYMGTLAEDEQKMDLKAYVRVSNNSGEDYEDAETRLIVGKVHILDQIADLARREYPYERPGEVMRVEEDKAKPGRDIRLGRRASRALRAKLREIKKEGLSEYFLYTIEGKETIPTGWAKRLLSFETEAVPVINLYKYDEQRYGGSVRRFLSFKNDKRHKLGDTPIPGGMLRAYKTVDRADHLAYVGQSSFKYIPVDEDVELDLGAVEDVVVKPILMDYKTDNYKFDSGQNIAGWDEVRTFKIEVKNTRAMPAKIEIERDFDTQYWQLKKSGDFGQFENVDFKTVKFTLLLEPRSKRQFNYVLTTHHGTRIDDFKKD